MQTSSSELNVANNRNMSGSFIGGVSEVSRGGTGLSKKKETGIRGVGQLEMFKMDGIADNGFRCAKV